MSIKKRKNIYKDKVFIVTGASSGLGRELARHLNRSGAVVIGMARRLKRLTDLKAQVLFPDNFNPLQCDITDRQQCRKHVMDIVKNFGRIDGVVLNAGLSMKGDSADIEYEKYLQVTDVNYLSNVYLFNLLFPYLVKSRGLCLVIGSLLGLIPYPFHSGYVGSKHALMGWAESLRLEYSDKPIRIITAACTYMKTEASMNSLTNNRRLVETPSRGTQKGLAPGDVSERILKDINRGRNRLFPVKFHEKIFLFLYKIVPAFSEKLLVLKKNNEYR